MKCVRPPLFFVVGLINLLLIQVNAQRDEIKPPTNNSNYERKEFVANNGTKLVYWLMEPEQIKAKETYPLVLALHGRGGNTEAAAVLGVDEMRKKYPCFVMAPAISQKEIWALPQDMSEKRTETQRLPQCLEALEGLKEEYPIDPSRIYVTGQSLGGVGSFGAVAASPDTFAAAIPVCGGWNPADAGKMIGVAFWIFHGAEDSVVPVDQSRRMVAALKQAGGSPQYTEYPGVKHNSWRQAYASESTWQWLFTQRRRK